MRPSRWTMCLTLTALAAVGLVIYGAPVGPGDFDEECDVDLLDYMYLADCIGGSGPGDPPDSAECLAMSQSGVPRGFDFDMDDDVDLADFAAFQRVFTGKGVPASLPVKHVTFDNIGIHDPYSENFNDDCASCHGDRTAELALDGFTPTAHNRMLCIFGELSWFCVACHAEGRVDFLSESAGALRKQISLSGIGADCTGCHCQGITPLAPDFYVCE